MCCWQEKQWGQEISSGWKRCCWCCVVLTETWLRFYWWLEFTMRAIIVQVTLLITICWCVWAKLNHYMTTVWCTWIAVRFSANWQNIWNLTWPSKWNPRLSDGPPNRKWGLWVCGERLWRHAALWSVKGKHVWAGGRPHTRDSINPQTDRMMGCSSPLLP